MSQDVAVPSLFQEFATTAEGVGVTTKRLEKAAILGAYFAALSDTDLRRAARYFAGHLFPLSDQRTVNVGGAALITAIVAATGVEETQVRQRLVARGDAGDVMEEIFPTTGSSPALTLADVESFLDQLAAASGSRKKVEMVTALLCQAAAPIEAKYLVKLLQGDLRIGLKEGAVEDALARLAGEPVERVQWANMLTGDIGEAALLARHSRLGEARMRLFHPLKFMLATPAEDLADVARQMPPAFAVEDKFDGIRAQAHIAPVKGNDDTISHGVVAQGVRVALFSRTLDEITESFPDLVALLAALAARGSLILDGEIVPIDPESGAILPFQSLQPRLGRKAPTAEVQARQPVAFVAYDILYGEERVLLEEPFSVRRAVLETLSVEGNRTRVAASRVFTDAMELDAEFDAARGRGNEGLMIKDPRSPYKPGRRGRDWLKLKRALATLDVVITAAQVGEGRRSRFLSDYTFAVRASESDPTLLNVGKAYSGLTDAETQELSDWCMAHTTASYAHGKVRAVEPQVVLEVTFDRVQASARHKSGFALRFPRILRIRQDKPPTEIDTLETVRRLADSR